MKLGTSPNLDTPQNSFYSHNLVIFLIPFASCFYNIIIEFQLLCSFSNYSFLLTPSLTKVWLKFNQSNFTPSYQFMNYNKNFHLIPWIDVQHSHTLLPLIFTFNFKIQNNKHQFLKSKTNFSFSFTPKKIVSYLCVLFYSFSLLSSQPFPSYLFLFIVFHNHHIVFLICISNFNL